MQKVRFHLPGNGISILVLTSRCTLASLLQLSPPSLKLHNPQSLEQQRSSRSFTRRCTYMRSRRTQARYKCAHCHTTNNTNLLFFWNNYLFWKEIDDFYFQLYVYGFARAHAYISVWQILLSVPGNMCSRRMERSHLHPPCIFSPGSKLRGNEFPKGGKKKKIS